MSIFGKSKKRQADEAATKKIKESGEGKYKTTARRSDNPEGGKSIKRGSTVTGTKTERTVGYIKTQPVTRPDFKTPDKTITEYKEQDLQKEGSGYKVYTRKTTPDLIKKLGENPVKGNARMEAQVKKQPTYKYKGKEEHAGKNITTILQGKTIKGQTTPGRSIPVKDTKTGIAVKKPKKFGITIVKRRVGGDYGAKQKGQNYKRADLVVSRKKKSDVTIPLVKYRTKTKGSKSKR